MAKAKDRSNSRALERKWDDKVLRLTLRLIDSSSFFRHLTIIY